MRPGPNTNRTSQRVCGHFGHSNNQYYKLLTQRRELAKLFQNRICRPLLKKPNLDRNLLNTVSSTPNQSLRELKRMSWSIVSNAAERSSNVSATALPESIEAAMPFWIFRGADSVEWGLL